MQAYICTICGFLYDDESADLAPDGTRIEFKDLDLEWGCPGCGSKGQLFQTADSVRPPDIPVEENNNK